MQGIFPDILKHAKIVPLHKSGARDEATNFRPISILHVISKIFEKIVHKRLFGFLTKFDILSPNQYGFRKGHSTAHALHQLTHSIRSGLDAREVCIAVFLDLAKAFDTVPHDVLLRKLQHYGVRYRELDWFASYLSNRKQYVELNGARSELAPVSFGLPQGTILGPLFFTLMLNDLFHSQPLEAIAFADDTTLICKNHDPKELINMTNRGLDMIYNWLCANKLKVNIEKSKYMVFSKRKNVVLEPLVMSNQSIQICSTYKCLSLTIDDRLKFDEHIARVCRKMAFCSHVMWRREYSLSLKHRKLLYECFGASHLRYCVSLWGSASVKSLHCVEVLQRRLIRSFRCHITAPSTDDLFVRLGILNIKKLHIYEVGCIMHGIVHGQAPTNMQLMFPTRDEVHSHFTRSGGNLRKPKIRLSLMKKDLSWCGTNLWLTLSEQLRNLPIPQFKTGLREFLLLGSGEVG